MLTTVSIPYTTSSNTTAGYISTGSGVNFTRVTKVIGVVKSYLARLEMVTFLLRYIVKMQKIFERKEKNMVQQLADLEESDGLTLCKLNKL